MPNSFFIPHMTNAWDLVKESAHRATIKHFSKDVEVRITYIPKAPSPYTVHFLSCKHAGSDLAKMLSRIEETIKHLPDKI